jgi:hypothetical protein
VHDQVFESKKSARNTIKNYPIPTFKGMLTGARGSMVEAVGYKPEGRGHWIF